MYNSKASPKGAINTGGNNVKGLMDEIATLKAEKFLMEQDWKEKYSRAISKHASSLRSTPNSDNHVQDDANYQSLLLSIKKDLLQNSFLISDERFKELKQLDPRTLNPADFFRMTVHEMIKPFKVMLDTEQQKFQE